jgi:F-type H+-transporting ATPase subunit delta
VLRGAIARRYASAVFDLGLRSETLDRWLADLQLIADAFDNRKLAFVLREPKIPFARKEHIIRELLGPRVQPLAVNLALLLVERERVDLARPVAREFEQMLNEYRNQAVAEVTTAVPIHPTLQQALTRQLEELTGKHIIMKTRVDPTILGGVVARVGDMLIDGSIRRKLALLREQIISGGLSTGPGEESADGSSRGPQGPVAPLPPTGQAPTDGTGLS